MRGAGIREYLRHGQSLTILLCYTNTHEAAVQVYILGMPDVTCLDEFLRDNTFTAANQLAGIISCTIRFSGIRVNTTDKIDIVFHCFICFSFV